MTRFFARSIVRTVFCAAALASIATPLPALAAPAPESFADQVQTMTPAVVNISTTQKVKGRGNLPGLEGLEGDEQMRQFFEKMLPPGAIPSPQEQQDVQSLGSGFIIDPTGYIVTNNHVIADATEIHITLSDNTKLDAEIVGHDPKTDIALLRVKTEKPLPAVNFGDSDTARVGDWVIAVGNPFGLGGTVTAGIISARARNINAGPFDDFIQTDASINRGNSGGPLFNLKGEVIGINTAIFSPTGGSIGIGFAVPSALAESVIAQLKEHGRTFRGWLGVTIQPVTTEIADSLGLKNTNGALVADVNADSPAAKAGIKTGDIITKFGDKDITEMRFLPRMVAESKIGAKVPLTVVRDGKESKIPVTLGELKEDQVAVKEDEKGQKIEKEDMETFSVGGMSIATIDDGLRKRFALPDDVKGLVIVELKAGSEAAKQGLNFGDVVQQVNGADVATLDAYKKAIDVAKKSSRKHVLLRVWRSGNNSFVTIPTDAKVE